MKLWVVMSNNGQYLDSTNRLVSFNCARVFKSEKFAIEKIAKLEAKKAYTAGTLNVVMRDITEKKRMSFREMIEHLNNKNLDVIEDSKNYKLVACSKYGFLSTKYRGYHTLEERFVKNINKAAVYKTFPEMYATMQIYKAFVQIPAEHVIKIWVAAGDYKDEKESNEKLSELINLLEGNDMSVCFLA